MKLIVLGSGTTVPHKDRAAPGFWLETSAGLIVLDVSPDVPHRMAKENLPWHEIDAFWVSHFHLDHLGGLAPFLFSTRWAPQIQNRKKLLRICGPKGLRRLVETFNDANQYKLFDQKFQLEFFEVGPNEEFAILPGVSAQTFSTPHTTESLAIRLTEKDGTSLVYTGDTGFSELLLEFCRDATLLLLECSFHQHRPVERHLELAEAMEIAKKCSPKKLVLTHLYPEWDGIDLASEALAFWSGETIEARDGLRIEIL